MTHSATAKDGACQLVGKRANLRRGRLSAQLGCNTSCFTPHDHGFASERPVIGGGDEMTTDVEGVVDGTMGREEPLSRFRGLEPLHFSFSSADRDMAALSPVVHPLASVVNRGEPHLLESRRVGLKMVRDEMARGKALLLQKLAH